MYINYFKRIFDFFLSIILLLLVSPIIFFSFIIVFIELHESPIFFQYRVGRFGKLFRIIKIKSMYSVSADVSNITLFCDQRISSSGRFLRKYKIDELLQLWNVMIGEMSFVGPRPDVLEMYDFSDMQVIRLISVRPGITSPASIKFKNEEYLLSNVSDPVYYNKTVIWPEKLKINNIYISNISFTHDISIIFKTIFSTYFNA